MDSILKRLKEATGPDYKIDKAIAEKFNDWHYSTNGIARECHSYTSSIDAALALVERMLPDYRVHVSALCGTAQADICKKDNEYPFGKPFNAATPPLAILTALFSALEAKAHD